MNIEEYRAMVKEEKEGTQEEQPIIEEEELEQPEEEVEEETEEDESQFVEINGDKIDINELKSGYLRQSDYTKKTQNLAREKEEIDEALVFYENVKNNPNAIESLRQNVPIPRGADPAQEHLMKLEEELYDMKLDNEINLMQSKYEDFEVMDVLSFASENKLTNLEDAYILQKGRRGSDPTSKVSDSAPDMDSIKAEMKAEIMKELKDSKSTSSIISSKQGGNVQKIDEIKISGKEAEIASAMGLTGKEYTKWRDIGN